TTGPRSPTVPLRLVLRAAPARAAPPARAAWRGDASPDHRPRRTVVGPPWVLVLHQPGVPSPPVPTGAAGTVAHRHDTAGHTTATDRAPGTADTAGPAGATTPAAGASGRPTGAHRGSDHARAGSARTGYAPRSGDTGPAAGPTAGRARGDD